MMLMCDVSSFGKGNGDPILNNITASLRREVDSVLGKWHGGVLSFRGDYSEDGTECEDYTDITEQVTRAVLILWAAQCKSLDDWSDYPERTPFWMPHSGYADPAPSIRAMIESQASHDSAPGDSAEPPRKRCRIGRAGERQGQEAATSIH